jgi:hypothetical protein
LKGVDALPEMADGNGFAFLAGGLVMVDGRAEGEAVVARSAVGVG